MVELNIDIDFDVVALIDENDNRIPLSEIDEEGYQTPEWWDYVTVGFVFRYNGQLFTYMFEAGDIKYFTPGIKYTAPKFTISEY